MAFLLQGIGAQPAPGSEFIAQPIDQNPVVGELVAVGGSWQLTLQGDQRQELSGEDLLFIRRKDHALPAGTPGAQVILANGDRLRATPREADGEKLQAYSELLGQVSIPLERVQGILLDPPADARGRERLCRQLGTQQWKHDQLIFGNGDELPGSFVALSATAIHFEGPRGQIEIAKTGVRAIVLASELISFPRPEGLYSEALLRDGSVLSLLNAELQGSNLRGEAAFGGQVTIPLEQLIGIDFRNGRVTYLSDLEPVLYRPMPYFQIPFRYQRDRTVSGNFLRLRSRLFRKGIGMHSRSELTYVLDRPYRRFEAMVGIDDETRGRGSVVFGVLLDGQMAWESGPVTGKQAALPARVDISAATRLTLVVDFADGADVLDHADWGAARLVR